LRRPHCWLGFLCRKLKAQQCAARIYRFSLDALVNMVDALAPRVALRIRAAQQCAVRDAHDTTAL